MKTLIFSIAFSALFFLHNGYATFILAYHGLVNKAELKIIDSAYAQALQFYCQAFAESDRLYVSHLPDPGVQVYLLESIAGRKCTTFLA